MLTASHYRLFEIRRL